MSDDCPICYLELEGRVAELSCSHKFHMNCLQLQILHDESGQPPRCAMSRASVDSWIIEDAQYWEVKKILDHKWRGRHTFYLVEWMDSSSSWEPKKNLTDSRSIKRSCNAEILQLIGQEEP